MPQKVVHGGLPPLTAWNPIVTGDLLQYKKCDNIDLGPWGRVIGHAIMKVKYLLKY